VIDCVARWSAETDLAASWLVGWLGLGASKYFAWKQRDGKVNEHNGAVPRDHWLEPWEETAIGAFAREHPRDGYRRLTFNDAGCGWGRGEPGLEVSRARHGRMAPALERDPQPEGHGVRATSHASVFDTPVLKMLWRICAPSRRRAGSVLLGIPCS